MCTARCKLSAKPSSRASTPTTFTGKEPQKIFSENEPSVSHVSRRQNSASCLCGELSCCGPGTGVCLGGVLLEEVSVGKGHTEVGEGPGPSGTRAVPGVGQLLGGR